ncbi:MAG TPA: hypothetical protein LFW21_07145 [Rickettsia endosymbiont of Pyrocoelia pectoralis]|nr:hypothetical protein [Rickettsia endosymbiont of Pyrocoelia pectoralis]
MTELVQNNIINQKLLNTLTTQEYSKGNSPFCSRQLCYFIRSDNYKRINCINFATPGIDNARHHIIDAATFLKPVWNQFKIFLSIIKNEYENEDGTRI